MDALRDLGRWLVYNWSDLGNFVLAAVVAWAAWIGVRLNQRLAEAELDPAISIYIEPDRHYYSFFYLIITNAGRGPARNVRFGVYPDVPVEPENPDSRLSQLALVRDGIGFMAPHQEIRTYYGSMTSLAREPITITVQYDRDTINPPKSRSVRAAFVLDVTPFEGLSQIGEPVELTAARALDEIASDLRAIKQGGSQWNPTITIRRRYFFSLAINRMLRRWFGHGYVNRNSTAWRHFRKEASSVVRLSRIGRQSLSIFGKLARCLIKFRDG